MVTSGLKKRASRSPVNTSSYEEIRRYEFLHEEFRNYEFLHEEIRNYEFLRNFISFELRDSSSWPYDNVPCEGLE
jgi:hypothetical protein